MSAMTFSDLPRDVREYIGRLTNWSHYTPRKYRLNDICAAMLGFYEKDKVVVLESEIFLYSKSRMEKMQVRERVFDDAFEKSLTIPTYLHDPLGYSVVTTYKHGLGHVGARVMQHRRSWRCFRKMRKIIDFHGLDIHGLDVQHIVGRTRTRTLLIETQQAIIAKLEKKKFEEMCCV